MLPWKRWGALNKISGYPWRMSSTHFIKQIEAVGWSASFHIHSFLKQVSSSYSFIHAFIKRHSVYHPWRLVWPQESLQLTKGYSYMSPAWFIKVLHSCPRPTLPPTPMTTFMTLTPNLWPPPGPCSTSSFLFFSSNCSFLSVPSPQHVRREIGFHP